MSTTPFPFPLNKLNSTSLTPFENVVINGGELILDEFEMEEEDDEDE
jgi:hypothetical protein